MPHYAQQERRALADLLLQVGPDAPTLCEGWQARDLAAHLVLRERRPDAAPGILLRPLAGYTDRVQRTIRDGRSWPALVGAVRTGPPLPLRLGFVDEPVNTVELFVHHEDVRRAQEGWEPRVLDSGLERALWSRLRLMARMARRRAPVGLLLEAPGYGQVTVRPGLPQVTVVGEPGELLLLLFGRQQAARLEWRGDPGAVERVRRARFGL
ncbi:MAG TPA: TIGR03085 family metal-binding protein [Acidimicrobiales bacterium]|nr:TIGR03085 family metal-binding protein [Acidimicrobiales bacterium]